MAKFLAAVKAIALLAGIWLILGVVALVSGALPTDERVEVVAPETLEPEAPEAPQDEPEAEPVAVEAPIAETPDTVTEDEPETPTLAVHAAPLARALVCESAEHAAIGVGSVVGDARLEWIVVCERTAHILAHDPAAGRVSRLARVRRAGDGPAQPARPAAADIDGDGHADLVLGFVDLDAQGGPDGGALVWVRGMPSGALGEPVKLATIAATSFVAADLDDRPGVDLAAVHWADGFGRRPSELWVFGGGASPSRITRTRLRDDGASVAAGLLDDDDRLDLVTVDATGAMHFSGVAGARYASGTAMALTGGRRAVSGDLDGDGRDEIFLLGDGLFVVGEPPADSEDRALQPRPIDAPHGIREMLIADVNADARPDLVLLTRQRVAALVREGDGFREQLLVDLPGTFRPLDFAISELVGGARAILVIGLTRAGVELAVLPLGPMMELDPTAVVPPAEDAPLVLDVTLP